MRAAELADAYRGRRPATRRVTAAGLLAVACALHGCGEGGPGGSARATSDAPVLVPIDSVVLAESDSSYVTEANDLAISPDGTFYIADRHAKRVHVFGRDGRYLRGLGRGGRGPGEFHSPGFLAFGGDSLLYVVDTSEIESFDLRTSLHAGSYPMPRRPGTLSVSSGRLFAGYADPVRNGSVARVAGDSAGMRVTGPLPELLNDAGLFPMVSSVALAMKGDTAATAFVVTDYLYLSDVTGSVLDSIRVPVRRRNGAHPDLLRRFSRNPADQELGEAAIYGSSGPMDLHWLPGERIALVSIDWRVVNERLVDSSFVSVVDPRTRRGCVDARVPGPTDPPVSVGLRGDTLFVLAQDVGDGTRASTVIRWYRIDTAACRWVGG